MKKVVYTDKTPAMQAYLSMMSRLKGKYAVGTKMWYLAENYRLVITIAKDYQMKCELSIEDLIASGNEGLLQAIEHYDPARGSFSDYAPNWIKKCIREAMTKEGRLIVLPSNVRELQGKIIRAREQFVQCEYRDPDAYELAELLGVEAEAVELALSCMSTCESLDVPIGRDGEDEFTALDMTADTSMPMPDMGLEREDEAYRLTKLTQCLSAREREIVYSRELQELTYEQIAVREGVSTERVRQIYRKAIEKLRENAGMQ